MLAAEENAVGYVDYITLSSSLLFSAKYATSLKELRSSGIYNNIRMTDYYADGYLDGVVVDKCDYRELFNRYCNRDDVLFVVDPPYLSTDVCTYNNKHWRLGDYLDVLNILAGHKYVYFTSNKSSIVELCSWLGDKGFANPFAGCARHDRAATLNHNSSYVDIMLYNLA